MSDIGKVLYSRIKCEYIVIGRIHININGGFPQNTFVMHFFCVSVVSPFTFPFQFDKFWFWMEFSLGSPEITCIAAKIYILHILHISNFPCYARPKSAEKFHILKNHVSGDTLLFRTADLAALHMHTERLLVVRRSLHSLFNRNHIGCGQHIQGVFF